MEAPRISKQLVFLLFFPLTILYEEMLLRSFVGGAVDYHSLLIAAFSLIYGGLTALLIDLLPKKTYRTIAAFGFTSILAVLYCVEYTVYSFFQSYYEVSTMVTMAADVAGHFAGEAVSAIRSAAPFILLSLLPLCVLGMLHRFITAPLRLHPDTKFGIAACCVLLDCVLIVPMVLGSTLPDDRDAFTSDYTANGAIPRFGVMTALRLEGIYSVTGLPLNFTDLSPISSEPIPSPVVYDYNAMEIDFHALAEQETNQTMQSLHRYFAAKIPTQQNEYTGMFEDKNLVYLVCEAFCPYVIDPELTPTLYRLSTEGFVFRNYYQPDWTQSTFGGEFAAVSGLVPTWINGIYSFTHTADNAMPFALGNQLRSRGYVTAAFHNHYAGYYGRTETHPNLGYDFKAIRQGLKLPTQCWPNSDLEMMQATIDTYIENFVSTGQPFHTYYMTVSGHTAYNFQGNNQAKKHKDEVSHLEHSDTIRAYLACQLEVEYALSYLMQQLEAAGIADDTVIALTSDHYPYALTHNSSKDYYHELEPVDTTEQDPARYRNSFLLWCGSMEDPIVIDAPCSSIDILPTLSNLFGLEYDSRLFSGRDILAANYDVSDPDSPHPFVVFADKGSGYSWISLAGEYNAFQGTFTPAPGYEAYAENADYLNAMHKKAKNMFKFARAIVTEDYYKLLQNR